MELHGMILLIKVELFCLYGFQEGLRLLHFYKVRYHLDLAGENRIVIVYDKVTDLAETE